ncbi:HD domain-containing phosphohydrolase [Nitrosomonas sp.]|uniref:HD domain-containing phosphohydrolase n=1 Tax=Nitrosomonas sp. TaxID=42353 RepID=UPI00283F6FD0|nr:HD domain-containing phosphohydrolase [Nitrosomonas sp.]MDR4515170.1 HD domain-containing protein [Nitrosomonas sp.]
MFHHKDSLEALNQHLPLKQKIISAHRVIMEKFDFIARIAITLYDPETRILKTYIDSSGGDQPLKHYEALLENAGSLKEILDKGQPRVVNNLVTFEHGKHEHTRRVGRQGYAASYTMPMFHSGRFFGFLFFNSYKPDVFDEKTLKDLDIFGHLVSLIVINELSMFNVMDAALKTTSDITHMRDPETGSHLDRMSRYSRLIAQALAEKYELDDTYIEHIFMFSPLHDVGKIAIPDTILLKPGPLDEKERKIMNNHTSIGRAMIDGIVANFGLDCIEQIDVLKNIAEFHHEAMNGSGYPSGKKGSEIPLEARIVAVADIFDALTSIRPYKKAWSNDEAFNLLKQLAGEKLDSDCVNALINNRVEIERIQQQFQENFYG